MALSPLARECARSNVHIHIGHPVDGYRCISCQATRIPGPNTGEPWYTGQLERRDDVIFRGEFSRDAATLLISA